MPSEFERRVRAVEDEIRGLAREHMYIFDTEGQIVSESRGLHDGVYIPEPVARGRLVVHTHPNQTSFSRSDVRAVLDLQIAEMRVITEDYRYVLRLLSRDSWAEIAQRVRELYYDEGEGLADAMRAGLLTETEADRLHLHQVWERLAGERGWYYRREMLDP